MDEIQKSLINAGFSRVEAATYITLSTQGPMPVNKLAKINNHFRANVYQALERLKAKGFVSEIQGQKSKLFEALPPKHVLENFKSKENSLSSSLAMLEKLKVSSYSTANIKIIEGVNGWKHLLNEFLESNKERVVYGVPKNAIDVMQDFFTEYHKKRAKKKLVLRHIYNYEAKDRIKITNKLPYTKSKYLPRELDQPVSTSICGSVVAITTYQGRDILTIVIDNAMIAKAYRKYFEFLWRNSSS